MDLKIFCVNKAYIWILDQKKDPDLVIPLLGSFHVAGFYEKAGLNDPEIVIQRISKKRFLDHGSWISALLNSGLVKLVVNYLMFSLVFVILGW